MGDSFHYAEIRMECVFNQILSVTGHGDSGDFDILRRLCIDFPELAEHGVNRVAKVVDIIPVQQRMILADEDSFCGSGTRVNA